MHSQINIFNSLDFEGEEVEADEGAAPSNENKNMVRLSNFDMIKVIDRRSFAKVLMVELKTTRRIYAMEELATDDEHIDWVQTATNPPSVPGLSSLLHPDSEQTVLCYRPRRRLFVPHAEARQALKH